MWSARTNSAQELAEGVNRTFTKGTRISHIVRTTGKPDSFVRSWQGLTPTTCSLLYRFGGDTVEIYTSVRADRGDDPLRAKFTGAAYTMQRNETQGIASGSDQGGFGPVIERVVNDENPGATNFMIDLDSGRLVTPPSPREAGLNWTLVNGIDAIGDADHVPGLRTTGGTVVKPVSRDAWDNFTAADVRQIVVPLITTLQGGVAMPATSKLPTTFAFKTREGGMGLLQITGFTNSPPGVKIRYKLVQETSAESKGSRPNPAATIDYQKVLDTVKAIEIWDEPFFDALRKKDLELARDLAPQVLARIQDYNHLVRGTRFEQPEAEGLFAKAVEALKAGHLDRAMILYEAFQNTGGDFGEELEALAAEQRGAISETAAPLNAKEQDLLRRWSARTNSVQELAEAVNGTFTSGTPVSRVVEILGTGDKIVRSFSATGPSTCSLRYWFG